MKLSLCIFLFTFLSYGQVVNYEGVKHLVFTLKHATDTTTVDGIDWKKENLISEFTLQGKFPLKYSIKIENDSVAILLKYENAEWILQENIHISDWTLNDIDNYKIVSKFRIIDFNEDNNEDLLCAIFINMHNNISSNIFLNDPSQEKLLKLYDHVEDTDVWSNPTYNKKRMTINCKVYSGLFGIQSESTYKLTNNIIVPLNKIVIDFTSYEFMVIEKFYGYAGKWHLVKEKRKRIRDYNTD